MILIKRIEDVQNVPEKFRKIIAASWEELMLAYDDFGFNPEEDGYYIFLEENDDLVNFPHLNASENGLLGRPWEGVIWKRELDLYNVVYMCNNQFAITVWIDGEHCPAELKSMLDEEREEY
jgi:hypothetical protein